MIRLLETSLLAFGSALSASVTPPQAALERDFANPPAAARPIVWWDWMNGNVTRAGITTDLEAMARVGIGGAQIFNLAERIPPGPVEYLGPAWRELVVHAAEEADRLGLELGIHNGAGWSSSGGPWIPAELAMQRVVTSETEVSGPRSFSERLPQPATSLDFYRDVAVLAFPKARGSGRLVDHLAKGGFDVRIDLQPNPTELDRDSIIDRASIVDLTSLLEDDGDLRWSVPAGDWTILRVGHTPTGAQNLPAPDSGRGLECDKLRAAALDLHWSRAMQPVLDDLARAGARSLHACVLDSYEVGPQNWTAALPQEFAARRGYDLRPWLPALTGRAVESGDASERFFWDLRRTIADLYADEYHGRLAALCREAGLQSWIEPYYGPFDSMRSGLAADVPVGEYWLNGNHAQTCDLVASIAHVAGRRIVAAEVFTTNPQSGPWSESPFALKAPGDRIFARGVNRMAIHSFAHQPWPEGVPARSPGITMGRWGIRFERTTTWWAQSAAWLGYLARCQSLLQRGQPVADVLELLGEGAGLTAKPADELERRGFRRDLCGRNTLLGEIDVRDGRIHLPSGASYRALALPDSRYMTGELLERVHALVEKGATVIGRKPDRSPSLRDHPRADELVRRLAAEAWGDCDGARVRTNAFGKGRVCFGDPVATVLAQLGVLPDCEIDARDPALKTAWIHRVVDGADVYFVSNQEARAIDARCTFRVSGKRPEIWRPDTGEIQLAPVWSSANGRTSVTIRLDPMGSAFVVLRKPAGEIDPVVSVVEPPADAARQRESFVPAIEIAVGDDGSTDVSAYRSGAYRLDRASGRGLRVELGPLGDPIELTGPWKVRFPAGHGAPESATFETLHSWTDDGDAGVRYFSGTAVYEKEFDVPTDWLGIDHLVWLDLGRIECVAEVSLNGRDLGTWWKPPFAAEVGALAKRGSNKLEVRVTNQWVNRLVGDAQAADDDCEWTGKALARWPEWLIENRPRPSSRRITFTTWKHYNQSSELLPAGLLGPVKLWPGRRAQAK